MADTITDPADFMVAPLIGNIFVMINKTCCIKDDVVISLVIENSRSAAWGTAKTETNSFSSVLSGFVM